MCDGETRPDYNAIWQQAEQWIEESREGRQVEVHQPQVYYQHETDVSANISIRQVIKVHHHAPIQARALLVLLASIVVSYLLYIFWPWRGVFIALAILAALLLLARYLVIPLLAQIKATWPARSTEGQGRQYRQETHQEHSQPEISPLYEYQRYK